MFPIQIELSWPKWSRKSGPKSKNGVEKSNVRNNSRARAGRASAMVYFCNYMDPTPHGYGGIRRYAVRNTIVYYNVYYTSCRVRAAADGRGAAYLTPKLCCNQNGRAKVAQRRKMGSKKRKSAIARKYARAVARQWCSFVTTRTPHLMGMME